MFGLSKIRQKRRRRGVGAAEIYLKWFQIPMGTKNAYHSQFQNLLSSSENKILVSAIWDVDIVILDTVFLYSSNRNAVCAWFRAFFLLCIYVIVIVWYLSSPCSSVICVFVSKVLFYSFGKHKCKMQGYMQSAIHSY